MNNSEVRTYLMDRLGQVETRIGAACGRSGRPRGAVTLVAVTKSVGPTVATLMTELGVLDLGESRPQSLWHKAEPLAPAVRWHLIGHLQRNKIERTLRRVYLVHSVDSVRLLDALEVEVQKLGRRLDILLEVNASRDENKDGFAPDELIRLAPRLAELRNVSVRGLMTMAALSDKAEDSRTTFAEVRHLRDRLQKEVGPELKLDHLSMGMSNDFEVAIEEGATLIRVGSAIFEGLTAVGAK